MIDERRTTKRERGNKCLGIKLYTTLTINSGNPDLLCPLTCLRAHTYDKKLFPFLCSFYPSASLTEWL